MNKTQLTEKLLERARQGDKQRLVSAVMAGDARTPLSSYTWRSIVLPLLQKDPDSSELDRLPASKHSDLLDAYGAWVDAVSKPGPSGPLSSDTRAIGKATAAFGALDEFVADSKPKRKPAAKKPAARKAAPAKKPASKKKPAADSGERFGAGVNVWVKWPGAPGGYRPAVYAYKTTTGKAVVNLHNVDTKGVPQASLGANRNFPMSDVTSSRPRGAAAHPTDKPKKPAARKSAPKKPAARKSAPKKPAARKSAPKPATPKRTTPSKPMRGAKWRVKLDLLFEEI